MNRAYDAPYQTISIRLFEYELPTYYALSLELAGSISLGTVNIMTIISLWVNQVITTLHGKSDSTVNLDS